MIGQEHVTEPLMQALRSNRVNHAYLFSGPRGCGKTTSARILARILNCAQNTEATPTATPCGTCPSCLELATGGPGSLDVVEIDAASHGGVDDARDLRERATFSPTRDRFKIFILDEAHMVTAQGFNALLKIVEEPPPYLKFIFATTEPEKVIGTIRSRTHHYPFKLVAPETMHAYLVDLCASENITAEDGVLQLVVRAGGGSVRDTLSVLDQLIAGAQNGELHYNQAAALLGFTPSTLLDDVVEALAQRNGAALFKVIEHIIATGHEPRRFIEDLLERLRDLIVIALSGESATTVLATVPTDQYARMEAQARMLGVAELSRAADVTNTALSDMSGATSPRLHLELLCARLLLPAADNTAQGLGARIDGIERTLAQGLPAAPQAQHIPVSDEPAAPVEAADAAEHSAERTAPIATADGTRRGSLRPESTRRKPAQQPHTPKPVVPESTAMSSAAPTATSPQATGIFGQPQPTPQEPVAAAAPEQSINNAPESSPATEKTQGDVTGADAGPAPSVELDVFKKRWPDVLDALTRQSRASWALVNQYAEIVGLDAQTLYIALPNPQLVGTLNTRGGDQHIAAAVHETLGFTVSVLIDVAGSPALTPAPSSVSTHIEPEPASPAPQAEETPQPPADPEEPEKPTSTPFDAQATVSIFGAAVGALAGTNKLHSTTPPTIGSATEAVVDELRTPTRDAAEHPQFAPPPAAPDLRHAQQSAATAESAPPQWDTPPEPPAHEDYPPAEYPTDNVGPANGTPGMRQDTASTPVPAHTAAPTSPSPAGSVPPWEESPRRAAERRAQEQAAQDAVRKAIVDDPQPDDEDLESSNLVGVPLIKHMLGGVVIEEITDEV